MMRQHLARAAVLVGLIWATGACEGGLTDINENPNAPTDVPAGFLLAQSIQSAVQQTIGGRLMLAHASTWVQHTVQIQYPDEETGAVRAASMEGYWGGYYSGSLADIQGVVEQGVESANANVEAVGKIWKSWIFHNVTDLWGDVPYSESLQFAANTTPAYDAQADVYDGLLVELTSAASALDPGASSFDQGDLIYGGDMAAWRRFANSLRMRLAMRLSEVDPATAQAQFAAAYNAGGFTSNADNAWLQYPGSPYENPLYENYLTRDDDGVSATMIDTLKSLNDPRLFLYAEPAQLDGEYRGLGNGRDDLPAGQSLASLSRIGNFWRADGAATPAAIMTYAEVLFLQAEAAQRGWIAADPAALYTAAIRANMDLYDGYGVGPTDAEVTAYLAQPAVVFDPANALSQIYLQKWIALWMNGVEAFADWRRTDLPAHQMGPDLILSRIPVRFTYPDSEQSLNKANLDAALARQGGGLQLIDTVWWDVN